MQKKKQNNENKIVKKPNANESVSRGLKGQAASVLIWNNAVLKPSMTMALHGMQQHNCEPAQMRKKGKEAAKKANERRNCPTVPVESVMPLLHKEHNEGKPKRPSRRIRTPSKGTSCPSFVGEGPQQGEHTPYWMHAGHADKRDVCEGFLKHSCWLWSQSISGACRILLPLTLLPATFQSFSASVAVPCFL